jgi:hypothetical protein
LGEKGQKVPKSWKKTKKKEKQEEAIASFFLPNGTT